MAPESSKEIGTPFIKTAVPHKQSLPELLVRKLRSSRTPLAIHSRRSQHPAIRVVCLSDTHNTKPSIPPGDILLHAGDLSQNGLFDEIQAQLDWLNEQPHQHKIVVAGNHDLILDEEFVRNYPDRELDRPGKSRGNLEWGSVLYVQDELVDVSCNGRLVKIYGSPMTPRCGNFAFQYDPAEDVWANEIPSEMDILLVHGPPRLHLDQDKGCKYLLKEIWRVRPKMIVFGHIHGGRGEETVQFDQLQYYYEQTLLGIRPWRSLLMMGFYTLTQSRRVPRTAGNNVRTSRFLNVAVVAGRGNQDRNEPLLAYI